MYTTSSNDSDFVTEFLNWCEDKHENNANIIICGDFNIDWNNDSVARRRLFQGINDIGLFQVVDKPTRIAKKTQALPLIYA